MIKTIAYAGDVITMSLTETIKSIYYKLTVVLPRPLPKTDEEFEKLKDIFIKYYGVPDKPNVWYTISAHIQSTNPIKMTKPYSWLINPALRLEINQLAETRKNTYAAIHNDELKQKFAKTLAVVENETKENMTVTSDNIQGVVDVPAGTNLFPEPRST